MIDGYTETSEKWAKRNDLHVRLMEQAGEDRVLFHNTRPQEHVNMRFPEYVDLATRNSSQITAHAFAGSPYCGLYVEPQR